MNDTTIEAVYLDFAKAFDKINHLVLLAKLSRLGIGGKLLGVIRSYLKGRKQFVKMGDAQSPSLDVTSGVPQGSILGPLLFIIYVSSLPDDISTMPFMFADDTKLLSIRKQNEDSTLQRDLHYLENWCREHFMEFNIDKCHVINFSNKNSNNLKLYGTFLDQSNVEKDLGVYVCDNMKWKEHIKIACTMANKVLNLIKRNVGNQINSYHKLNLYNSIVLPILSYASPASSPSKGDLTTIEHVQLRATIWIL